MQAFTLRPHWAWFVGDSYKDIENRSWSTRLRRRIGIYASTSRVTRAGCERPPKSRRGKVSRPAAWWGASEMVDCLANSPLVLVKW